jgi:hypothetical protein
LDRKTDDRKMGPDSAREMEPQRRKDRKGSRSFAAWVLGSGVDAFEVPCAGREVHEAEEGVVFELDVPFDALPAFGGVPPVAGEGEGAVDGTDGTGVGAVEEGEGVVVALAELGGDADGGWGAEAGQRQGR